MRILNPRQEIFLKDERRLLDDLMITLVQFGAAPEDQETLRQSIRQLDDLFLLVIVGEFNAGKSAFINALLGQKFLREGVTPTTTQINILRFGDNEEQDESGGSQSIIKLPADLLQEMSIVDTPGTNAIIREHEVITSRFVPRSDLVLFVTSVDRPFTESERLFLKNIRDWGKKVVIVLNKIDILENEEDLLQVKEFVEKNSNLLLGITPEIFPISARQALRSKQGEPGLWKESRFGPLEQYIQDTLDEKGRLKLKLNNPLGVGSHLVADYLKMTASQFSALKVDLELLEDVDRQLSLYNEDMRRNFNAWMADIEKTLFEMEQRGESFFDETFRLARVFDLLSKNRIRREFEQTVVGDAPQRIEQKVGELIDWLVEGSLRQWQAVTEHLAGRRQKHQAHLIGDSGQGGFQYDRRRLIDALGREAQRVVETYDKNHEGKAIAEAARTAVATSAAMEAGAVGLGTLVTVFATTVASDLTGVLMASFVAALGLFIIPTRRRQGKARMREKVSTLRQRLTQSLRKQFEGEMERSLQQINEAIAPYSRFIRSEKEKLQKTQTVLEKTEAGLNQMRKEIDTL